MKEKKALWGVVPIAIGAAFLGSGIVAGCGGDDSGTTTVTSDGGTDGAVVDSSKADTSTGTDGSSGGDAGACLPGSTVCGSTCVSTDSDLLNCGKCGNACKTGEVCSKGTCALSCGGGTTKCSTTCFDLQSDPSHCGDCNTACAQGERCLSGKCALSCPSNLTECGGADAGSDAGPAYCTNTMVDTANCGTCGNTCPAGQACNSGVCQLGCVTSVGCPSTASVCTNSVCSVPKDCSELHATRPQATSGMYTIDPDGAGGMAPFDAYCDMTTYGGGWTIVNGITGADGEEGLTSDTEEAGNPLAFEAYNANRAKKMALSALETESIFVRQDGTWLRASAPLFDQNLNTANSESAISVTLEANDGTNDLGFMGYSNYNIAGGGDFGVSINPDGPTSGGGTVNGFDHHNAAYWHLNYSCVRQYLYSYSEVNEDGDPGYDVNTALGSWAVTNACDGNEGGALVFYSAMRRLISMGTSCKAILDAGTGTTDGNYVIDPDGAGGNDPFVAYCDMTHGGYTLLVSANGSNTTFGNNAAAWGVADTIGQTPTGLVNIDYKSPAYGSLATNDIRLCYQDAAHCHTFSHGMNSTLLNFFTSDVSYVEYSQDIWGYTDTGSSTSRTTYESELGVASNQANCNWLGINHKETATDGVTKQGFSAIGLTGDVNCGCQSYFDDGSHGCNTNNWTDDFALGVGMQSCNDASGCSYGGSSNLAGTTEFGGVANPTGPWFVLGR